MSSSNSNRSGLPNRIIVVVAVILTLVCTVIALPKAQWVPALIAIPVAAFAMEGLSLSLSAAGYFSMASPLFFLALLSGAIESTEFGGFLPVMLAVSIAGLSTLARLLAPSPEAIHLTSTTRATGASLNIIRVALVGATIIGLTTLGVNVALAVIPGIIVWMILDLFLTTMLINATEEPETSEIWNAIPFTGRAILALAPLVGLLVPSPIGADLSYGIIAVVGVALLGFAFRGTARYYIDEIVLLDQRDLQLSLNKAQHREKMLNDQITTVQSENKHLGEELGAVYTMAESLGASTKVEETLSVVGRMIKTLHIPYNSCVIMLDKDGTLTAEWSETPYQNVLAMSSLLQLEEPLIRKVIESRKARLDPQMRSSPEGRIFKNESSVMCVPLLVSKEIIGVIYIGANKPNTHTEDHLKHLKMIAALAAPSIKTALLFEEKDKGLKDEQTRRADVEAKNAQLAELQLMGQKMGATLKTSTAIQVVAESLRKMISEAQSVILFTPDEEQSGGHALKAEFADTPYAGYVNNLALRDDEGMLGKAIELNGTLLVANTELSDIPNLLGSERSVVVAPLMIRASEETPSDQKEPSERELLGCLYVGAAKENAFTEDHRNLIETVSYQTAMALKNARLYEQTQQQALTDGLTGLYTHRLFQEKLSEEIAWADRNDQPIVLVMVDCDNFKTYNDTLGHPAGDALLKEVAALLKDKVRATDIVCRYGGDEFALLLKQTQKEDAIRMCERIREAFQLRFGASQIQVTASIGLACYPTDALTKTDLAKAADDALYVAKRGGRNLVAPSKTLAERNAKPIVQEVLPRTVAHY